MDPSTTPQKISRNTLAYLLMFATVMLWGATFVQIKQAVARIQPQWFNSARMTVAFLCLAIAYRGHWRRITPAAWLAGTGAGACMAAGYFFQTQGLVFTSATNSAFLTALVVVLVPFLASIPGLRAAGAALPAWPAWAGAGLAFLGVALLTTPARTPWLHLLRTLNRGDVLSICCAVAFAAQIIVLDRSARRIDFQQLTLLQVGFAMLLLIAGAWLTEPPAPHAAARLLSPGSPLTQPVVLIAIAVTGVLATALAFSIQTWAQQVIPATNIGIIVTLEPVFAWLTAFVVLHERMHLRSGLGALLVLTGILAAELLPRWCRANK